MCTLTLAWQVFADAPVVVAANRDEQRDRPSEPPARIESDPAVFGPRDAQAGGTWLGYNASGLFVGVTNRWVDADLAGERSRGLLVRDALREPSAEEAVRMVENAVEDDEYAGFNLVLADETAAFLLEWDGRLIVRRFDPGVHAVVNVGASDAPAFPEARPERGQEQARNAAAVQTELIPEPGETSDEWRARATAVLGDHEYGVCVHENGYGTVSASVLAIGADGTVEFEFADGPPCETAFEAVDATVDVE